MLTYGSPPATLAGGVPLLTSRQGVFSFIGMFNGVPDLAEPSEEILHKEFTKRRYLWLTGGTRWLGARVGRSADYLSMAQFDLLSWVLGGWASDKARCPSPAGAPILAA